MLLSIGAPTIFLIIFYVVPICIMGMYSFWKIDDYGTLDPVWNLNQYKTFFNNPVYFQLMKKSLLMAAINCGICFSVSYPLAYFIAKKAPKRIRYALLLLTIIPSWTSFLIRTYSWMLILGEKGVVNHTLTSLGLIDEPVQLMFNSFAVIISLVHIYLPFMVIPLYNSIEKIDDQLTDAAENLGANKSQSFFHIVFRMSLPGIVSGIIIVFIPSIGEYVVPMIVGGNSGMMYSNAVTAQFLITNWPLGAALSIILLIVILLLFGAFSRVMKVEQLWSSR